MSQAERTYWRSLEELADDPAARRLLEGEFPEGASEPPSGVTRREMIQLLGASVSLAGLAACRRPVERIVPHVDPPPEIVPGIPLRYATTLPHGLEAYGVVVTSHEGRPTKIEGNDLHPSTRGASSAWLQAAILDLYDPDRAHHVSAGDERKTWDEFVTAWAAIDAEHVAAAGQGLAILTRPFSSPTLARLARAVGERLPRARLVAWEPLGEENALAGLARATGTPLLPVHHFARADVVVAIDADPLLTEGNAVRDGRGFSERRRVGSTADGMNRLWAVECPLSLTGANADHRVALKSSQVPVFFAWLAYELFQRGVVLERPLGPPAHIPGLERGFIQRMADDLVAHRGRSLIVVGQRQPPLVHAMAQRLNAGLGNVGRGVTYGSLADAAPPSTPALEALVGAMREGAVRTLVILGGNPVYDAPVDLAFGEATAQVERVVVAVEAPNETARLAGWRIPLAHPLEAWGDARAADGTPSVIQPLIEPLYRAKSEVELLGLIASGVDLPGHERVQETWRALLGEVEFERRWSRVLHDGVFAEGAIAPVEPGPGRPVSDDLFRSAERVLGSPARTELVLLTSARVGDGQRANNGWLQELPDPITKLTWENAALLGPRTAEALGVGRADLVRVTLGDRSIELPVLVVPGQAEDTVAIELGWGRSAAGRVGSGRGADAYRLRTTAAPWFASGVTIEPTGARRELATTQDHHVLDELGREERAARVPRLIREATLSEYRANPDFARDLDPPHPPLESLWREPAYDSGMQWGMSIDLNLCTGCSACVVACQAENNIPVVGPAQVREGREMHWLRVDRYFSGAPEAPRAVFQPVPCMHCENAPCEQVCPVAATVHDDEGLNTMVYNRCIGTRYCSNNCPYKVRRFNFFNYTKDTPAVTQLAFNPDVTVRSRGVMEKCTYCTQRINAAKLAAKLAGRALADGDVRTACQQACPADAIAFGDLRDENAEVSRRKAQERDYTLLVEMNNKPRTTYLAKLRNPAGEGGA